MTTDIYAPEWRDAPDYAIAHTVTEEGWGVWWSMCPVLVVGFDAATEQQYEAWGVTNPFWLEQHAYPWAGENPDHRNSLRFHPK